MNGVGARFKRAVCVVFLLVFTMTAAAVPASAKVGQTYVSRVQGLRVRRQPGSTDVITKLKKGQKVIHKGTSSGWWLIKTEEGYTGYVYRTYLKSLAQKIVKNGFYRIYKANNVTVRKAPRSTADALGTLKRGTTVQLKAKSGDWGLVLTGAGNKGWVQLKYLQYLRG